MPVSQSSGHLRQILLVFLVSVVCLCSAQSTSCPPRCLCFRTTVRCMFLQLDRIPKVPRDTTILDLRFNRIEEIPPGSFSNLKHLNTLLLNNNRIKKIDDGAFDELPELRYLYLYKNQIRSIGRLAFDGLRQLEQLYIHFNELEDLEADTFSKLTRLERLFLHNNRIQRLPKGLFSNLKSLLRLRLDSNALICDCHMIWLSEMLKNNRGHTQAAVTCESPVSIQGKSLLTVTEEDFHCRKPQLTVMPHDVEVTFGTTAYFTCRADGDPQPEIIWLHNNHEILTNSVDSRSRYTIMDDGTLMIENTQDADQGTYECVARNIAGEAKTGAVELTYVGNPVPPRFLIRPTDQSLIQGETLTLDCSAAGHPQAGITWLHDNLHIPPDDRIQRLRSGMLTIDPVQYEDRGVYECQASNNLGSISATASVEVRVQPQFTQRPEDQEVVQGNSLQLVCFTHGYPTPSVSWTKNGRPLSGDPHIILSSDSSTIFLQSVRSSDQGVYECRAENSAGVRQVTAEVTVVTRDPPRFTRTPTDFQVPVHGSVELQCGARGNPTPSISWRRNSVVVSANSRMFISGGGDLAIYDIRFSDEGLYECVAENTAGTIHSYARVNVLEGDTAYIGDSFVDESVKEAIVAVNRAFNNTLHELRNPNRQRTPGELLTLFRLPSSPRALEITRSAEIYERALEIVLRHVHEGHSRGHSYNVSSNVSYQELISPSHIAIIANLSNCAAHRRVINCSDMCFHQKYRTYDGTCNNLQHPMWGSSLTQLQRVVENNYEDGFHMPVGWDRNRWYNGHPLPSARTVSMRLVSAHEVEEDEDYTHMLMQWGQFVDHDLDFSPQAVSNARFSDGRRCNETCDNQSPCFPIPVPEDDPRIHHHRCMGVTRSSAMCGSGMTSIFYHQVVPREQLNQITHYMDASNVYGSSEEEALTLRDIAGQRGLMRTGIITPSGKDLLPSNVDEPIDCQIDPNTAHIPCFQAGDHRANEQLGLLSMHTIWMREHNRIATELLNLNPHWDGDTIYHETRKIIGGMMQHITFTHFLPKILGPEGMAHIGSYNGYNPNQDASIINSFSTAAYRFGHSLINPVIYRLNETFQPNHWGNLPLHRAFFAPFRIVEEGGIDPVLRGLFGKAGKKVQPDALLNSELTERLFKLAHQVALDLASLNIQRGRDHGLPFYNAYRQYCGLREAQTFDDLRWEISNANIRRKLREVYGHPENIDVWVGGLLEDVAPGARVGPTFQCIIAEQFRRTRDGDRFWYSNPGVFSDAQLTQIKQVTLARVICDSADNIQLIQPDVFIKAEYPSGYISCNSDEIPHVNLNLWTHCCEDCASTGEFNSITNNIFRRRRRSVDYSYTDEKPGFNEISRNVSHIFLPNDQVSVETAPHGHNAHDPGSHDHQHIQHEEMDKAFQEMSHKMMDMIDIRLEGVESVMVNFDKAVRKLKRKMRNLERSMKSAMQATQTFSTCTDDFGGERVDGEQWREHDCRSCSCQAGRTECVTQSCPLAKCDSPQKIVGQCCPVC